MRENIASLLIAISRNIGWDYSVDPYKNKMAKNYI